MPLSSTDQFNNQDILIPVVGATGAGKSFFINALLQEKKMAVGNALSSCTTNIDFGYMKDCDQYPALRGYRVVLIDTPGFNDYSIENFQITAQIETWLTEACTKGAKVGGIIYLHDITTSRFDGACYQNLQALRILWGSDRKFDNVILTTTKWSMPSEVSNLEDLHTQLIATYWKDFIGQGARVRRFSNNHTSALNVIHPILSRLIERIEPEVFQSRRRGVASPTASKPNGKGDTPSPLKKAFLPFIGLFQRRGRNSL